jgi:predicted transposase/invertase (TIGR01784 family)
LLEFLAYIEASTDDTVKHAKENLVKRIHKRVQEVKNDISMEVKFMTLLERDREKIEEGIEKGREEGRVEGSTEKALRVAEKMLSRGDKLEDIVDITELPMEKVLELKKKYQN